MTNALQWSLTGLVIGGLWYSTYHSVPPDHTGLRGHQGHLPQHDLVSQLQVGGVQKNAS
jgi:hypothetical protein